jgi:hypothetical protein
VWFWLIVGVLQLLTGVLILQRNVLARRGLRLRQRPHDRLRHVVFSLWAIAVLTLDSLILYALLSRSDAFTG